MFELWAPPYWNSPQGGPPRACTALQSLAVWPRGGSIVLPAHFWCWEQSDSPTESCMLGPRLPAVIAAAGGGGGASCRLRRRLYLSMSVLFWQLTSWSCPSSCAGGCRPTRTPRSTWDGPATEEVSSRWPAAHWISRDRLHLLLHWL